MENPKQPLLVPFKCEKCGHIVAWTLPGSVVFCKRCKKWIAQPTPEQTSA